MPWGIVSGVYGAPCEVLEGEREIPCLLRGKSKQEGSACPVVGGMTSSTGWWMRARG